MALIDDDKKRQQGTSLVRAPDAAASASGALPAVGRWVAGPHPIGDGKGPNAPAVTRPTTRFAAPDYTRMGGAGGAGQVPARPQVTAAPAAAATPAATATPTVRPNFANVRQIVATRQSPVANPASTTGRPAGSGDPAPAGGGSASGFYVGGDGKKRTINADGSVAGANQNLVTVNRQSFGSRPAANGQVATSAAPEPQAVARPRLASSYGQSVITMPDDNLVQRPQVAVRGADAMAEHYNSREDRELRNKVLGDLDSQRFRLEMIAQNPGRRGRAAIDALGDNARQQAAIVGGSAQLDAEAIQGRANRANVLANTGMEQAGADNRAALDSDNRLQVASMQDATERSRIASGISRPLVQAADGTYYRVGNDGPAEAVTGADGKAIAGPQAKDAGQVTPDALLKDLQAREAAILEAGQMGGAVDADALAQVRAERAQLLDGGKSAAPAGMRQVGTSSGKPVYEDANGNRFTY